MRHRFFTQINRNWIIFTIAALALSTLACNAAAFTGSPAPPQTVQPSADALASFQDKWRDLSRSTPSGPFSITFTEAELTSAVTAAIQESESSSGQSWPISNVTVALNDDQITVYGSARIDPLAINGSLAVVPYVDESGYVQLSLVNVDFGPLTLNENMLNEIISRVERSINAPIQSSPFDITIQTITVTSDQITINGTIQ